MMKEFYAGVLWLVCLAVLHSAAQTYPFENPGTIPDVKVRHRNKEARALNGVSNAPDCHVSSPADRLRFATRPDVLPLGYIPTFGNGTHNISQALISKDTGLYVYRLMEIPEVLDSEPLVLYCGPVTGHPSNYLVVYRGSAVSKSGAFQRIYIDRVFNETHVIPDFVFWCRLARPLCNLTVTIDYFSTGRRVTLSGIIGGFDEFAKEPGVTVPLLGLRNESGQYTTHAYNLFNDVPFTRTVRVDIQFKVSFTGTRQLVKAIIGQPLNITCQVSGAPNLSELEATYPDQSTQSILSRYVPLRHGYAPSAVLILGSESAHDGHKGTYTIVGSNLLGTSQIQVEVVLLRPPSAPQNVTVVGSSQYTVELAFQAPANNTLPDTTWYDVNCELQHGGYSHSSRANTTSLTASITGLHPGERYRCVIAAHTIAGVGPAVSIEHTLENYAPCPPKIAASSFGTAVTLNIRVPCSGGDNDLKCVLQRTPADGFKELDLNHTCKVGVATITDDNVQLDVPYTYTFGIQNSLGSASVVAFITPSNLPPPQTGNETNAFIDDLFPQADSQHGKGDSVSVTVIAGSATAGTLLVVALIFVLRVVHRNRVGELKLVHLEPGSSRTRSAPADRTTVKSDQPKTGRVPLSQQDSSHTLVTSEILNTDTGSPPTQPKIVKEAYGIVNGRSKITVADGLCEEDERGARYAVENSCEIIEQDDENEIYEQDKAVDAHNRKGAMTHAHNNPFAAFTPDRTFGDFSMGSVLHTEESSGAHAAFYNDMGNAHGSRKVSDGWGTIVD